MAWSEEGGPPCGGQDAQLKPEPRAGSGTRWSSQEEAGRAMRGDTERQPVRAKTRKQRRRAAKKHTACCSRPGWQKVRGGGEGEASMDLWLH